MNINKQNIPTSWSIKRLGDILSITSCKRVHESEWTTSGVPFYRARELVALHDKLPIEPLFISEELYEKNTKLSGCSQAGDLLVTGVGTIGIQYLVKPGDRFYFKDGNIIWLKNEDKINGEFLYYSFDGQFIRKQILNAAGVGTVGTYTIDNAKKTYVMVPPIGEQKKIAEILGTWDRAIEELTGLIAEKKELKRSLMQQLLTGEIRISGFTKPWKKVKLGEIGTTYTGLNGKNKDDFGKGSYFIPYMNVYQNNKIDPKHLELVEVFDNENQNIVQYGDIFFTTSSETPEEVGFTSVLLFKPEQKIYLNSFCFGYRLNNFDTLLPNYASFLFRSKQMRKIMYKLAQGATRFNLSKNELMKERVYIPVDISEQHTIADVLSTIDCEIDLLNQRLDVLKEQKRGLMQKLLTGEVRVKVDVE